VECKRNGRSKHERIELKYCAAIVRDEGAQKEYYLRGASKEMGVYWRRAQSILLVFARAGSKISVSFFLD
jgi:hypothetical protein